MLGDLGGVQVGVARYDIETLATAIADSLLGAGECAGRPGLRLARVLVEGGFPEHGIEDFLKGAFRRRRVLADVIGRVLGEDARLQGLSVSCQPSIAVEA